MIVTCERCQTRYSLEPASLGPRGRTVRCARCGHSWNQPPPPDLPRTVDPPPHPFPRPGEPASPERRRASPALVAVLAVVLLVGVVAALYLGRERIVAAWPASEWLYAAIGLSPRSTLEGLEIVARMERIVEGGATVVVVSGEIVNTTDRAIDAPMLRGVFRDAGRNELEAWTFAPAGDRLLPGQSIPFSDRFENPPEEATDLVVVFDEAG
jgi:predicted Zn finger-like uncharacterized protein